MRAIKTLIIIGLILATGYIFGLAILLMQLAAERSYCRNTDLDKMSKADYQYCLEINR